MTIIGALRLRSTSWLMPSVETDRTMFRPLVHPQRVAMCLWLGKLALNRPPHLSNKGARKLALSLPGLRSHVYFVLGNEKLCRLIVPQLLRLPRRNCQVPAIRQRLLICR